MVLSASSVSALDEYGSTWYVPAPGHVAVDRHGRVRGGHAGRLPPLAAVDRARARRAAPSCSASCWCPGVGLQVNGVVALVRLWPVHPPALGVREARAAPVRGRPPRPAGRLDGRRPAHARAGHPRVRGRRLLADAAAEPRHHDRARRDRVRRCSSWPARRSVPRSVSASLGAVAARRPGPRAPVTAATGSSPSSTRGPTRSTPATRTSSPSWAWPREGSPARPRAEPGQVGVPALRPHRLHLRHHRRGARPARRPRGGRAVRGPRRDGGQGGLRGARSLRHAPRRRRHGVVRGAGAS